MQLNRLDKAINYVFPAWGAKRFAARAASEASERAYEMGAKGRRTANWKPPSSSAPTEIQRSLTDLRNRSRDLVRNNAYARRAVKKISITTVGTGIRPNPIISSAPQEKKLKQAWQAFAENTNCDFDGHLTFYGLQRLVMRTVAESGECIVRKRIVNDATLSLPLQLQVLEGDFIATMKHEPQADNDGHYVMYGIEFNKDHKVVAYYLYDTHPGDAFRFNLSWTRYPATEIIHIFEKERPGQYRGVPFGYSSGLRLKDLDEYEDAQLVRQKIAACFTVFLTEATASVPGQITDDEGDFLERVEPGIIERLKPGQQVTMASPPGAEGYGEYTKNVLRAVGAGYDMDYVSVTGDYSQTNFSSGRMGWIDFYKSVSDWQSNMLIPMFCQKVWTWFTQMAAIYGYIRAGLVVSASWNVPRREMINPEAEIKALIDAMQNGVISWTDAQLDAGNNPEEVLAQMVKDFKAFADNGLPIYSSKIAMGSKTDTNQAPPPAE